MTTMLQGLIDSGVEVNAMAIKDRWFEVDTESDLNVYSSMYMKSPVK